MSHSAGELANPFGVEAPTASSTPAVSVLMAAFNVELWIQSAIESFLDQTMADSELIIVDDGSTDGTWALIEGVADNPRIRVDRQPNNQGGSATRNRALTLARGAWLTILDADDWFGPLRLERLLQVAEEQGPLAVVGDLMTSVITDGREPAKGAESEPISDFPRVRSIATVDALACNVAIQPFFSRHLLERSNARYDPGFVVSPDLAFFVELLNSPGARVVQLQEHHYFYRIRAGSLTDHPDKRALRDKEFQTLTQRLDLRPEVADGVQRLASSHQIDNQIRDLLAELRHRRLIVAASNLIRHPQLVPLLWRSFKRWFNYRRLVHKSGTEGRRSSSRMSIESAPEKLS